MNGCGQFRSFGMSVVVHTNPTSHFPFVAVIELHTYTHNGELLGAILGMSGHCCMFSSWLFSKIPLMNRKWHDVWLVNQRVLSLSHVH